MWSPRGPNTTDDITRSLRRLEVGIERGLFQQQARSAPPTILARPWEEIDYLSYVCRFINDAHIAIV